MNMTGLILEGVCGVGKTSVLRALQAAPEFLERGGASLICLSEHHTQRVLEPLEQSSGLSAADHCAHLGGLLDFLAGLDARAARQDWSARGRGAHRVCFLLERFHFTHAVHYPYLDWNDLAGVDARLGGLNARVAILTASPDALSKRLFDPARDAGWFAYLRTISPDRDKVVAHYLAQQEQLLALRKKTCLPCQTFDASAAASAALAQQILDFWPLGG